MKINPLERHQLPALPYDLAALEPHIDARTMTLHHNMHHASYVKALNLALETAPELLRGKSAEWLLKNSKEIPKDIVKTVVNNAGGHLNHSFFWQSMSPHGGGIPLGALAEAIENSFENFEHFKFQFEKAGSEIFGSGWVWLVKVKHEDDRLQIVTTSGHANPLTEDYLPLLVNDVWEHAYYLKHENRRPDYLKGWWSIVDWKRIAQRFEQTQYATELVV